MKKTFILDTNVILSSGVWNKMRGKGVAMVAFDERDVVRSDLVKYAIERMKR